MLPELLSGIGLLAAGGFSARWNWWRPRAKGLPVLMYHKVGVPPAGSKLKKLWVSVEQLRRQKEYLKRRGYAPLTLRRVAELLDAGDAVPANAAVITFDDGYQNNLTEGLPVLREFGFPATIFVVVNAIGRDNFWHDPATETRVPMLTWDEVRALRDAGWDIGSHTLNHPRLARLTPEDARKELEESHATLAREMGVPPVSFAHPYGNGADDLPLRLLIQNAGYRTACTVHQGLADPVGAPLALRRIFVRGDDTRWDFHLNITRGRARL